MNRNVLLVALLVVIAMVPFEVRGAEKVFRLGMIGLDTSHVIAFTKLINNSQEEHGCKVVVGYSGGLAGYTLLGQPRGGFHKAAS